MADEIRTTRHPYATKVVKMGPPVDAPEWALRAGFGIASRHVQDFDTLAALAKDIAEALYNIAPPSCGGRNSIGG